MTYAVGWQPGGSSAIVTYVVARRRPTRRRPRNRRRLIPRSTTASQRADVAPRSMHFGDQFDLDGDVKGQLRHPHSRAGMTADLWPVELEDQIGAAVDHGRLVGEPRR